MKRADIRYGGKQDVRGETIEAGWWILVVETLDGPDFDTVGQPQVHGPYASLGRAAAVCRGQGWEL